MDTVIRLTRANLKSLVRDRAALFWTFFFPVMFVLLFGVLFSGGGDSKVPVAFVDQDNSPVSQGLLQAFRSVPIFDLKTGSLEDEKAAMQKGDVRAIVVVPKGLAETVASAKSGQKASAALQVYTDPSSSQSAQIVQSAVLQIANGFNLELAGGSSILTLQQLTIQSTQLNNVSYLVPSILAMALMQLGVFAAIPLVEQREKQILKRLGATPLQRWKLVASNVVMRLIVAAIDALLILGIGAAVFKVSIGNMLGVALLTFLGAATFLAIGYALAAFLRTEEQANGVVQVVQMPMMFLSGIFFPFDFMPDFLRVVARLLPLTYLGDAIRQVMVNGTQIAPLWMDVAILAAWLVVCLGISVRTFRWE